MRARQAVVLAAVLGFTTLPLQAEDAKERGGSSGSSSAGSRHHSSSSSSSSSASSGSSHHSSSSSSGVALTGPQARHPRAGTGSGWRDGHIYRGSGYGYGYYPSYYHGSYYGSYYGGRYLRPWYSGYGYYPWTGLYFDSYWGGGGYYSPRYSYGYYQNYRDNGALRLLVDKEKAKVYVDGYYAGIVDDFDGIFQRLYVSPGRHEVGLKLEGYKSKRFRVYVPSDGTIKVHYEMLRGEGEDGGPEYAGDERYKPEGGVRDEDWVSRDERRERYGDSEDNRWPRASEREREDRGERREPSEGRGMLRLDVRPDDASVYVDGEFQGSARDTRQLQLSPGLHKIEIVRPGYRTLEREIEVENDRPVDLAVSLEK